MKNSNILTLLEAAAFLDQHDEQSNQHFLQQPYCLSDGSKFAKENDSEKRMHHNELERQRRKELRTRVENLRKLVPGMEKSSTQRLLSNTAKYIQLLAAKEAKLQLKEQRAEKEHTKLCKILQQLQNSITFASDNSIHLVQPLSLSTNSSYQFATVFSRNEDRPSPSTEDSNSSGSLRSSSSSFSDYNYSDMSDCSFNSEDGNFAHGSKSDGSKIQNDEQLISDEDDDKQKGPSSRFRHSRRRRHRRPSCTVSVCEQYFADMVVEVEAAQDASKKRVRSKTFTEGTEYTKDEQI